MGESGEKGLKKPRVRLRRLFQKSQSKAISKEDFPTNLFGVNGHLTSNPFLIAGHNDNFHLFAVYGWAEPIRGSSAIGGKDNLNLIELPAGRAGDAQLTSGFSKFNLDGLSAGFIAARNHFFESLHINPHPFHAKP